MKFVYTEGKYREFRGYVFANGHPANVTDNATIEMLLTNPAFRRCDDEPQKVETPAEAKVLEPDACPKCGRIVKQGKVLHIKWCKG